MIVCKVCGHTNEAGAQFCGNCGSFLEWSGEAVGEPPQAAPPDVPVGVDADAPTTPIPVPTTPTEPVEAQRPDTQRVEPQPELPPGAIVCRNCGTANDPDRVYCRRCAAELTPVAADPAPPPPPVRRGPPVAVIAVGVVVALGLVGVAAIALLGGGPTTGAGVATPTPEVTPPPATPSPTPEPTPEPTPTPSPTPVPVPAGTLVVDIQSGNSRDLAIVAVDTLEITRLNTGSGNPQDAAWSPDGERLVYVQDGGLIVADADGSNRKRITAARSGDSLPTWAPEGDRIVFTRTRNDDQDIWSIDADGDGLERIVRRAGEDRGPSVGPDGRIAFVSDRDGDREIWTVAADGSDPQQLTDGDAGDVDPAWSPDGRLIAWATDRQGDGGLDIWVMNADGSDQRVVAASPDADHDPTWSPDGLFLAFHRGSENRQVIIVDLAGTELAVIAIDGASVNLPSWK